MGKKLLLLSSLFCCLLLVMVPFTSGADFGSFSGDSDFGSGWSSSSDWGSSSSGSSDWGSSTWGDSDGGFFIFGGPGSGSSSLGFDDIFSMLCTIVFMIIIASIVINLFRKHGTSIPGAQQTSASLLRPMTEYTALDPAFSASVLQESISNIYVQMQHGWTAKDISSLRPYFTDAYFAQMQRQLNALKYSGRTNYVERISVLGVTLRGWMQQEDNDHIIAVVASRIIDYTLDDETGALVSGSRTREKFMTYEMDLCRKTGMKSGSHSGTHTVNCPNCGAPLDINTTAKCPYCDSIVTVKAHDWAICGIKGLSQRTT